MNTPVTYDLILSYNRKPTLTPWFKQKLTELIAFGVYHNRTDLLVEQLITELEQYRLKHGVSTVVIGISGGIDSAVTAGLFKRAGYEVHGLTLDIHQEEAENNRGHSVCKKFDLIHTHVNLTKLYDDMLDWHMKTGDNTILDDTRAAAIRRGNIRARLRMMTLYNHASLHNGFVASTDNFSELAAGFWTLHGDVGDVSPIQSFTKSWEVPEAAKTLGVPPEVISALPTDGLGITTGGDEAQLGVSYLEFDIALFMLMRSVKSPSVLDNLTPEDAAIIDTVRQRIKRSRFKRANPYYLDHPYYGYRFHDLSLLDAALDN